MLDALFPLPTVNVGLNPDMAKDQRHGVVWMCSKEGNVEPRSFMVDKPKRLLRHNSRIIGDIFSQITKMGMQPVYLEVMLNDQSTVYKNGIDTPFFSRRLNS